MIKRFDQTADDKGTVALEPQRFDSPLDAKSSSDYSGHSTRADSRRSSTALAYTAAQRNETTRWWHLQFNLMLSVFGLLVLAALLFVWIVPSPIQNPETQLAEQPLEKLPDSEAPWVQIKLADTRLKAQDVLANLLSNKEALESKGVERWAPERFQLALNFAADGDKFYTQQNFEHAINLYQKAVTSLDDLFGYLPKEIERLMLDGQTALNQGKPELAKARFSRVLVLDPSNISAASGLDRVSQLERALDLLSQASTKEGAYEKRGDMDDLVSAERLLSQAKLISNSLPLVDDALTRVQSTITDKRFKVAMSVAYQALFDRRYTAARAAFAQALVIKPNESSARLAMQQALAADQDSSIATLLSAAERYERQEQWASAQSNYQIILQRDANQVSAKLGDIRSGARLKLDSQIQAVLADPLALARSGPKNTANNVLRDARAIRNQGARIKQQILEMELALSQINADLKVRIISDDITEISLQKIGSKILPLGRFNERKLTLKSGRYIVKGTRLGYQDVRLEIDLVPTKQSIQRFEVKCDQALEMRARSEG